MGAHDVATAPRGQADAGIGGVAQGHGGMMPPAAVPPLTRSVAVPPLTRPAAVPPLTGAAAAPPRPQRFQRRRPLR